MQSCSTKSKSKRFPAGYTLSFGDPAVHAVFVTETINAPEKQWLAATAGHLDCAPNRRRAGAVFG
jgi:pyruvate-formate lyase-activating enzyme